MLDENQGGQLAAEREPTPGTEQGQQDRPRDEAGRFVPQEGGEGQGERQEDEGTEGSERQAEEAGRTEEERQEQPREKEPGKTPAWAERRFGELTRKRQEAEDRVAALEAELERTRNAGRQQDGGQAEAEQQVRKDNPQLTAEQVRAEAQKLRAAERFNEDCNRTFDEGKAKFPDFEAAVGAFRNLGGLPQDFLEETIAAGNAHAVLYHLGRDLDEADRIMSLPPRARTAALVRLSDKLAAPPPPKPVSRAPAPIAPVGGAGRPSAVNTDPDSLSTAEWMRRRNAGEIR